MGVRLSRRFGELSLFRVLIAGLAAAGAYLLEQWIDRRIVPNRYDDILLWGGLLSRRSERQQWWGLAAHSLLGVALTVVYVATRGVAPGFSGWRRGVLFAQAENALLYPGVLVLEAIHPDIRSGRLPSLLTWGYFWVEVARHAAYGAVLGVLIPHAEGRER